MTWLALAFGLAMSACSSNDTDVLPPGATASGGKP